MGYPDDILTDQGSVFTGESWRSNCKGANLRLREIAPESNNALGQGETHHAMLRRIFNKVSIRNHCQPK